MVVDDDPTILEVIRLNLELNDMQVFTALDSQNAMAKMEDEVFDIALVDLMLNGNSGLDLMEKLHGIDPEIPIIILTGYGTIETAVDAMKKGAYTYLTKPVKMDELAMRIQSCLEKRDLSKEVKRLQNIVSEKYGFENIIGKSEKMKGVLFQVAKAAKSDAIVYISGESGTGKELFAKNLHLAGARRDGPFIAINCAAIPETLLESELFGYKKGAFTGAYQNKTGFLAQAQGGTFFFDEISEMSFNMQAKLLRVLEEKTITPLGGSKPVKLDIRILTASNKNLESEVKNRRFRQDLFYRIYVIVINLPPLRDRKEDIPLLAKHFLNKYLTLTNKTISGFSPSAIQKLLRHNWPGNVRELENTVEAAVALATEDVIGDEMILQTHQIAEKGLKSLKEAKQEFERDYLIQLIEFARGNVTRAAKLAGKYRADLYDLLKKYNINPADFRK
jgi:two-component system response regulator GlrR